MADDGKPIGIFERFREALSSPARTEILYFLARREASVREIATKVGASADATRYHLRALQEAELIELVTQPGGRGGAGNVYRTTIRSLVWSDGDWGRLSADQRSALSGGILAEIFGDSSTAFQSGTIDLRSDRHLTHLPLKLDEQGWKEVVELHTNTLHAILGIQAESNERAGRGEESFAALSVQMLFEMPVR